MPRPSIASRTRLYAAGGLLASLLMSSAISGRAATELPAAGPADPDPSALARFESSLEDLRRQLKIPGLSAAIVSAGRLAWARGFGHADLQREIEATPDTPYHLASVTKPFAAVLVLQLVEEGVLDLDDPVSEHGKRYEGDGVVRVHHLLSHTSRGEPGMEFRYDSDRFADLGWVLARASGRSFRQLLVERILTPLNMESSAPTPLSMGDGIVSPFRIWLDPRNVRVYGHLARPYALDRSFNVVGGDYPIIFSPAGGLISSASDLARFDIALEENRLLPEAAKLRMFAPALTPDGHELPYGLGWFSQNHGGTRLVWHYGWNPPTASALYLKLPDEGLTFVALANTDALSRPFDLGRADALVLDSAVALAFYETFVLEPRRGRRLPRIDWRADEETLSARLQSSAESEMAEVRERELLAHRRLFHSLGRVESVETLSAVHERVFPRSSPGGNDGLPALGEHLLPWPSVPLFGMGHVSAAAWFLLILLWMLVLWTVRTAKGVLAHGRRSPAPRHGAPGGVVPALGALGVLAGVAFYVVVLVQWPRAGPVSWFGGSLPARGLIAAAAASGGLAVVALVQAVAPSSGRGGSILGRLHRLLIASGVGAGAWALLNLVGWL